MPNEAFFHWNPELLGLGRQIGRINSGAFGVFLAKLSTPIFVLWVPCPCFLLINHYFYKKLSLYIQITNIELGLELDFVCSPWFNPTQHMTPEWTENWQNPSLCNVTVRKRVSWWQAEKLKRFSAFLVWRLIPDRNKFLSSSYALRISKGQ